jgi:hypothetical protein
MAATRNRLVGVLVSLVLSVATASGGSEKEPGYVKNGFYVGALSTFNIVTGDFDGSTFLVSSSAIYDVPDVDSGPGLGLVLGCRFERGAIEVGYQRSIHTTHSSFVDVGESTAAYNVIDFNVKFDVLQSVDFLARHRIKPYVLFGVGIPWLTIEDSATHGYSLEDETFVGFDLAVGTGVAYYFHPQWAVTGGLIYRWNWFGSVSGATIADSLTEHALGITVGIAYTF